MTVARVGQLEEYQKKRDFRKTPEPAGGEATAQAAGKADGLLYAVQKHAASRLHYDFRLELDGVLLSWAVPKGPSLDPRDRHLAARTEDHPLEYGNFEGTIPKGEYGGGTVLLWDRGTWEPNGDPHEMMRKGDLKFTLHGRKLKGSWVLVRMKTLPERGDKEEWLLIKHRDEEATETDGQRVLREQPESVASGRSLDEITAAGEASVWHGDLPADRQPDVRAGEEFVIDPATLPDARPEPQPPRFVAPELATLIKEAPVGDEWLHEIKFDGYRAIARIAHGSATMYSRNDKDWTDRYASIAAELSQLPVTSALLDGEVVVRLADGRTSFQALQRALGEEGTGHGDQPSRLYYCVFDLLHLDGFDLTRVPIEDRKELLRRLLGRVESGRILYTDHIVGSGRAVLEQACKMGLEGIVSKRASSPYRPGVRGREWVKTKCKNQQEFIIGGFTEPAGARTGFGALLVGVKSDGGLRYVGKVGTGFDEGVLSSLSERLKVLEVDRPPFTEDAGKARKNSHWVRPELVAEVEFTEWTRDGGIRHPSFKGLREDKPANGVVAEVPMSSEETMDGVKVTHPDRVFWPAPGVTKRELIEYYEMVAERMLPYVIDRPIAMVRCPSGVEDGDVEVRQHGGRPGGCFFHKHPADDFPGPVGRVMITESEGPSPYLTITGAGSLTALAQMGVLEIHVWGSTWPDIERPDMVVFDLDPGPGVEWNMLAEGARLVRKVLRSVHLESFVKTTGGKGLHVVVPLTPGPDWKEVSAFCRSVAQFIAELSPERFTANMSKSKRQGKMYVDYVRNTRGATSIAPFSSRAKEQPTVSVPVRWSELDGHIRPDTYTVESLKNRLRRLRGDPWEGYFEIRKAQSLDPALREALKTP
jgi:bifunctional non-homologous end joining protein LigD